jgi:hypothetical protein
VQGIIDATLSAAEAERYIKVAYPPVDLATDLADG